MTAGVRDIPRAWIEQTRAGGVIVLPWGTGYSGQNALLRLVVAGDGTASGRFTEPTRFMHVRAQREDWPDPSDYIPGDDWPDDTRRSATTLSTDVMGHDLFAPVDFAIGLWVSGCVYTSGRDSRGRPVMWLYGLDDHSWAMTFFDQDSSSGSEVFQGDSSNVVSRMTAEPGQRW